jgi:hypothetical protein
MKYGPAGQEPPFLGNQPIPPITAMWSHSIFLFMPTKNKTSASRDSFATSSSGGKILATQGMARFVLANGSMSSNQSGEKEVWLPS